MVVSDFLPCNIDLCSYLRNQTLKVNHVIKDSIFQIWVIWAIKIAIRNS